MWQRNLQTWECALAYRTKIEFMEPWVDEIYDPHLPWGLGCNVCRLAGIDSAYARGTIRAKSSRCRRTAMHRQAGWMQQLVVTQVPRSTVPTTPQSRDTVADQAEQCYRREPPYASRRSVVWHQGFGRGQPRCRLQCRICLPPRETSQPR